MQRRTTRALRRREISLGELGRAREQALDASEFHDVEAQPEHAPRSLDRFRGLVALAVLAIGCGIAADPAIASQLRKRVTRPAPGWASVPCEDRAAKVERLRPIVPLVHDLTGRVRTFATPLPPELVERIADHDLVAAVPEYRCVVQDWQAFDSRTEPNYLAGLRSFANLLVLAGQRDLQRGDTERGWAHVVAAVDLYRAPIGPELGEHLELAAVLAGVRAVIDEHAPPPHVVDALVESVDATVMPRATACASLRHELYVLAVVSFRAHLGKPEREAFVARFGVDLARQLWTGTPGGGNLKPGGHDRAAFDGWLAVHDALAKTCERQPLAKVVRALAAPVEDLARRDPPVGTAASAVVEHVKQYNAVQDAQLGMSATLRALQHIHREGREPTPQELAAAVRLPAASAWDGSMPVYAIANGTLTVIRGGTRFDVALR